MTDKHKSVPDHDPNGCVTGCPACAAESERDAIGTGLADKHTPGPWVAEDCGEVQPHRGRMVTIRDHRNIHIATVDGLDASVRGQELANARLIAAAPRMYTGHEHIILHAEDRCDCGRSYGNIARAAIEAMKGAI